MNCTPSRDAGRDLGAVHADADLQRQGQRRRLLRRSETNFPEGTIANLGEAAGLDRDRLGVPAAVLHRLSRARSRARCRRAASSRRCIGAYSVSGNVIQGGGIDQYGQLERDHELRDRGAGASARSTCSTAPTTRAAMFNPEGDAGDVEMWELICADPLPLARGSRRTSAGAGRHRGGSRFESLFMIWNTPFWEVQNLGNGAGLHLAGHLRRLPRRDRLHPQHPRQRPARARRCAARPTRSPTATYERAGADGDPGRARVRPRQLHDARADRRRATSTSR